MQKTDHDCFMRHRELHATAPYAIRVYVEEQDLGCAATNGAAGPVGDMLAAFAQRLLGFGPPQKLYRSASQTRFGTFVQLLPR